MSIKIFILKKYIKKCKTLNKVSAPVGTINYTSLCKMNVPEKEKKDINGKKNILMPENVPNLVKGE